MLQNRANNATFVSMCGLGRDSGTKRLRLPSSSYLATILEPSQRATGRTAGFDSRRRQEIFLCSIASRPALHPTA
jgi:hypothetical protein